MQNDRNIINLPAPNMDDADVAAAALAKRVGDAFASLAPEASEYAEQMRLRGLDPRNPGHVRVFADQVVAEKRSTNAAAASVVSAHQSVAITHVPMPDGGKPFALRNNRGETAADALERAISRGVSYAQPVLQKIMDLRIEDLLIGSNALEFDADTVGTGKDKRAQLMVSARSRDGQARTWTLHHNALGQLAQRAGIPMKYVNDLNEPGVLTERRMNLLAHNFRELYGMISGRYFVRTVGDEIRGFLSDRYKPFDGRALANTFVETATAAGARMFRGLWSDTKYSLTMLMPHVYDLGTDAVAFGLNFGHSDFGNGGVDVEGIILRLLCTNGMTGQSLIHKVHVGSRLRDDAAWSRRTMDLETRTVQSAITDAVQHALQPERLSMMQQALINLQNQETTIASVRSRFGKRLVKTELERLENLLRSDDVVNMPAGYTPTFDDDGKRVTSASERVGVSRVANALALLAQAQGVSDERRMDLERMGGELFAPVFKAQAKAVA